MRLSHDDYLKWKSAQKGLILEWHSVKTCRIRYGILQYTDSFLPYMEEMRPYSVVYRTGYGTYIAIYGDYNQSSQREILSNPIKNPIPGFIGFGKRISISFSGHGTSFQRFL